MVEFYKKNEKPEEVIHWSEQILKVNPIDAQSFYQLALAYQDIGKKEAALEHIIWAHFYNRNDRKIISHLKNIFFEHKLNYQDFTFQPEYQIATLENNIISIQANEAPWKAFASCKALWQNEEKYREDMSHLAHVLPDLIELKECLLNALITYNGMEMGKENYPLLGILKDALQKGMVNDFIFYEIQLRDNPNLIHFLPKEKIESLIQYLKTVRVSYGLGNT